MATTAIAITDYSDAYIRLVITDDGGQVETNTIKKTDYTTFVSGDNVYIYWTNPETERDRHIRTLDYNLVTSHTVADADELERVFTDFSPVALARAISENITITPDISEIQNANSVPILIPIPAPGAGKALVPLNCQIRYVWDTLGYNCFYIAITNVADIFLAEGLLYTPDNLMQAQASTIITKMFDPLAITIPAIKENEQLYLVADSDSVQGDAQLTFYITYKTITL